MLYVEDCVERAFRLAQRRIVDIDEPSYQNAYDIAFKVISGAAEPPIAAVQGPPGSGKTYIVERLAEDYIAEALHRGEELIFYVAPTNELTWEACARVLARYLAKFGASERCKAVRDLPYIVRVLGSRIGARYEGALKEECGGLDLRKMVDLTINNDVRLVFTTEFQRPYLETASPLKIIVDESSKSPFFRFFIPIVRRIVAKEYKDYPVSLVALGDPQQAITVEGYGRDILLMNVIKRNLDQHGLSGRFVMLERTFRLPAPSEEPISEGYYEGRLKAYYNAAQRFGSLYFDSNKILQRLISVEDISKSELQRVVNAIEEAVNNKIPLLVLETNRFPQGDTFDPARAKYGYYAALALKAWMEAESPSLTLGVASIYSDMHIAVRYRLGQVRYDVDTMTVQSLIGGERDIIVNILGKEYRSDEYEIYSTLYAMEPELLNVQLSRHKMLQVVIGCTSCLAKFKIRRGKLSDERIKITGDTIQRLIMEGKAKHVRMGS